MIFPKLSCYATDGFPPYSFIVPQTAMATFVAMDSSTRSPQIIQP